MQDHQVIKRSAILILILALVLNITLLVSIVLFFFIELKPIERTSKNTTVGFSFLELCQCGCQSIEPSFNEKIKATGRIINGEMARAHSWPWKVVLLIIDVNRNLLSFCGATLITDRHILTAAHCVHQHIPPFIYVFPGQDTFSFNISLTSGYRVNKMYVHEGFHVLLHHDLAILTIEQPLRFDSYIHPICLATPNSLSLETHEELTATGWGRVSATPGSIMYPQYLQQVKLNYVSTSHPNCSEIFRPIINVHPGQIPHGIIVNSKYRYDWANLVNFVYGDKCRFHTDGTASLFLCVFCLNPINDGTHWMRRDRQGAEVTFHIEKKIKQRFINAWQRDLKENFIQVKQ